MSTAEFCDQLARLLQSYNETHPEFDLTRNTLLVPAEPQALDDLVSLLQVTLPRDFIDFYTNYAGLELPDIHNSYHVYRLQAIINTVNRGWLPVLMQRDPSVNIIPFGGDGGGNVFAVVPNRDNSVYYLQGEFIDAPNGVCMYFEGVFEPKRIADSFTAFLEHVLDDTFADFASRPGWKYLDHGLYGPEPDP